MLAKYYSEKKANTMVYRPCHNEFQAAFVLKMLLYFKVFHFKRFYYLDLQRTLF